MTLHRNESPPYEKAPGILLMFEVDEAVLGFPYARIGSLNWSGDCGDALELLQFVFADQTVQVSGRNLKRLLLHLHKQELFLIRVGESQDPQFPQIVKIESIPKGEHA